jgi:hypothetical protein
MVIASTMNTRLVLTGAVLIAAAREAWRVLITVMLVAAAVDTKHVAPPRFIRSSGEVGLYLLFLIQEIIDELVSSA